MAEQATEVIARLRETFDSGRTRDLAWREAQLDALLRMVTEREDEIIEAIRADLSRPDYEVTVIELGATRLDLKETRKHLRSWAGPERAKLPWQLTGSRASIRRDPLGVVLVIAPWNYPFYLALTPLAAAIAAGNAVVVKPSEVSPASSAVMAKLMAEYLDADAIACVEGGVPETTALLEQRWDHILYTGNGTVGRIVAAAAAKHLTPVTLELGGKSPAIVARDANLKVAAQRIAAARFTNAGQTCIAADHVLVDAAVEEEFLDQLATAVSSRYGADPRTSPHFGRIINEQHTERLKRLLDAGGYDEIAFGGTVDVAGKYVAPTALRGVKPDAAVMGEEIFGPLLPIMAVDDLDGAIAQVNSGPKPLALYLFTRSDASVERVLARTSSGGVCVNDTMFQIIPGSLPFGGVGESGYGAYHGRWGFDTFSHLKPVLRKPAGIPELPVLRPPYKPWKLALGRKFF